MSVAPASPEPRPLPPRPSLEYERKTAKSLLRLLRAGDPDALARARAQHPTFDPCLHDQVRLSDAQLVVAREYGFASWPRLVRWFEDAERQRHGHVQIHGGREAMDAFVGQVLAEHRARLPWAARVLSAYVPRFYGLPLDDVFSRAPAEGDARLAVARMYGAPSWDALLERLEGDARTRTGDWEGDPMQQARTALVAADLDVLARIVEAHPELLHPSENDLSAGNTLMGLALWQERVQGVTAMRATMEWLEAHGFDRQRELNLRLRGHGGMTPEEVRTYLDQGADPNWVAPGGMPVLEHALLRYWNAEGVDALAARATPRRALWIAAALGDVNSVSSFLDDRGRPTSAATRLRPDFVAAGRPWFMPPLFDADDEEILAEALLVAVLNGRTAVLEYLASRGAPLKTLVYGAPLAVLAAGEGLIAGLEGLVRGGADLDLRPPHGFGGQSAGELAREMLLQGSPSDERRRIVELCGMNPDVILAEHDAIAQSAPSMETDLERAIILAGDDAAGLGQSEVGPVNLLVGLLRGGGPPLYFLKGVGLFEVDRFRADHAQRLTRAEEGAAGVDLPLHAEAQAALDAAVALAAAKRRPSVYGLNLLHALTADSNGPVALLLSRYGVNTTSLNSDLAQGL